MSDSVLLCGACGLSWQSRAAAVEIWRRGRCLACGSAMKRDAEQPQPSPHRLREPAAAPIARS